MEKIYSKVQSDLLLHIIRRIEDVEEQDGRVDIVPEDNFIQCSSLKMEKGKTFRPHKHIEKKRTHEKQIAQESWIVVSGSVKCFLFDIDDMIIATPTLNAGDASFTLRGGHTYEILEDNTYVYEYKTGPYEGQEFDKVFLNDEG